MADRILVLEDGRIKKFYEDHSEEEIFGED